MIRSAAKSTFMVQKAGRKKGTAPNHQTWDQTKVFMQREDSPANILARVKTGGAEPVVEVVSDAFRDGPVRLKVEFRNTPTSEIQGRMSLASSGFKSRFKRHLSDLKTQPEQKKAPELNVGDVVELQACLIDDDRTTLYPHRHRVIADAGRAQGVLMMPEVLGSLVASHLGEDRRPDQVYDYSVAVAAKGEARKITDVLSEARALTEYLNPTEMLLRGFLLRGKETPDAEVQIGVACMRTRKDDLNQTRASEVMMNFMKSRSHLFLTAMSEDNPWEVIPLYGFEGAPLIQDRLEMLANKAPFLVNREGALGGMNFAHMNLVLDISKTNRRPRLIHTNLCRSKPLVLDTSVPDRARERTFKIRTAPALAHPA